MALLFHRATIKEKRQMQNIMACPVGRP